MKISQRVRTTVILELEDTELKTIIGALNSHPDNQACMDMVRQITGSSYSNTPPEERTGWL